MELVVLGAKFLLCAGSTSLGREVALPVVGAPVVVAAVGCFVVVGSCFVDMLSISRLLFPTCLGHWAGRPVDRKTMILTVIKHGR